MKKIVLLAFCLLPAPVLADEVPAKAKPVTVPFELLKSGHMAVQVKVNGKGPYKLVFDTGAPITLVNNKLAKEAGLLEGKGKPAFTLFGSMGDVKIKTLEVAGQKAENVSAIVMDHPTVELMSKALKEQGPLYGIVGFPFFAQFRMTIDYQTKTLTFEPNGYKPPDVMKAMTTALMLTTPKPIVLAAAGQWGLVPGKESKVEAGLEIKDIRPGSPAAKAGLKAGDRLLTLDGRWTDTIEDLYAAARGVKPGTTVKVRVMRDKKEIELEVTPSAGL